MSALITFIQQCTEVLASAIKQEKDGIQFGKEEIKQSLPVDIIVYENLVESTKI